MSKELSHIDESGKASMVDVSQKQVSIRTAVASGVVVFPSEVFDALSAKDFLGHKGSIIQTAVIAGIQAVKKTSELIPLCHQLSLSKIQIDIIPVQTALQITCKVKCNEQTGVEMEALTGVSVAALTIYDMCKALSHNITISEIQLEQKTGGQHDFKLARRQAGAKLYGLVLSGGKSTRMGTDKGLIKYHGVPQREYLYNLLSKVCEETFISLRPEQESEVPFGLQTLVDLNEYKGPYNGLLSAHKRYPEAAWLVLACDLPLMDLEALKELISQRDTTKQATAFALKENPLPEPLCAIWEPHAFADSVSYLESGVGTCPRKFLINNDTKLVYPKNENVLLNANSEAEYKEALEKITF